MYNFFWKWVLDVVDVHCIMFLVQIWHGGIPGIPVSYM